MQQDWLHPIQIAAVLLCVFKRRGLHFEKQNCLTLTALQYELVSVSWFCMVLSDVAIPSRLYGFV